MRPNHSTPHGPRTVEVTLSEASDIGVQLADGRAAEMRMIPSRSGRWRVVQVGIPNLDQAEPHHIVVIDDCGKDPRVEVLDGIARERLDDEISVSGISTEEFKRQRDQLVAEAGDDIDRQIAAGRAIGKLSEERVVISTRQLCLLMQGHGVPWTGEAPDLSSIAQEAEELSESFCPGDPARALAGAPLVQLQTAPDDMVAYASLDLATPQSAVETLVDLTRAGEAFHFVLALDVDAQRQVYSDATSGRFRWFSDASWQELVAVDEHAGFALGLFDSVLRLGLEAEDLHIDLTAVESLSEPTELGQFGQRTGAVIIEAEVPGHDDGVAFVLLQAPSGRWRVRQVASPPDAIDPTLGLFP